LPSSQTPIQPLVRRREARKIALVNQRLMVDAAPERFFVPPYVGPSGWIGVWLDGNIDWAELQDLLRDAWRMTAPKKLVAALKED